MKEVEILTWNVNWFRGEEISTESNNYDFADCKESALNGFISEINKFFALEPSVDHIVFAQEVPYQYRENKALKPHPFWQKLFEAFPDNKYRIIYKKGESHLRKNIAIFKVNSGFSEVSVEGIDSPRLIPIKTDYAMFIGVHMPVVNRLLDKEDKVWTQVIDYTGNNKNVILAGDFNSYIGCNSKSTEYRYLELLNNAGNIVSENIKTFNNTTSIDKVLVGKDLNVIHYGIIPQEEQKFSDHRYIVAKLRIAE
ncbi:MAG: endonuclease/exonuclease/phosphatase family protein [Paludibacteraceae bacterium]|nr:endonuclease/exonuclease/phosphatase family protein [Paludibacteraceae bacterium]